MKRRSLRGRVPRILGAAILSVTLVASGAAAAQASTRSSEPQAGIQYTPDGRVIAGTISPANSTPVSASEAKELDAIRLGRVATPLITHPNCAGRTDFYEVVHVNNQGLFQDDCFANSGTYTYTMTDSRFLCPGNNTGRTFYWDPGTSAYYTSPWRGPSSACWNFTAPWPTVLQVQIQ